MTNLNDLKKKYNLSVIKVGENGLAVSQALVGFKSLEQAQDIAQKEGLKVCEYMNEGNTSSVYVKTGETPCFEYNILVQYEGYTKFYKEDVEEFQKIDIDERLETEDFTEEERRSFLEEMSIVKERIQNLTDGEFIILDNSGEYSEPIKENDMGAIINGDYYIIGVE